VDLGGERAGAQRIGLARPRRTALHVDGPGGSGLSLARAVRAGEDEGQRLPLIAVTGLFGKELEASIRQAGFDAYVPKPVDVELLARRVRSLVDKS